MGAKRMMLSKGFTHFNPNGEITRVKVTGYDADEMLEALREFIRVFRMKVS